MSGDPLHPIDASASASIVRESAQRIHGLLLRDPTASIARYPGHDTTDLVRHLWQVQDWALRTVVDRPASRLDRRSVDPEWTVEDLGVVFVSTAGNLADALESIEPEEPVWTFTDAGIARFWQLRMAHEASIHRWDVEAAHGTAGPIDTDVAVSGISEGLSIYVERPLAGAAVGGAGERVLLRVSDRDVAWLITLLDDRVEVSSLPRDPTADAVVRSGASGLWLYVTGRIPRSRLDWAGEELALEVLEGSLALAPSALS